MIGDYVIKQSFIIFLNIKQSKDDYNVNRSNIK